MSDFTTTIGSLRHQPRLFAVPPPAVAKVMPTQKPSGAPAFLWGLALAVTLGLTAVAVFAHYDVEESRLRGAIENAQQISASSGTR